MVQQQLERGKLNSSAEVAYAAAPVPETYRGLPTVHHGGSDAGYRSESLRFPDQHLSVACLCNIGSVFPVALAREVAESYLAGKFHEPVVPAKSAPLRNGKLVVAGLELTALSEDHFQLTIDADETYTFEKGQAGVPLRQWSRHEVGELFRGNSFCHSAPRPACTARVRFGFTFS